jgi:hypothetical protein
MHGANGYDGYGCNDGICIPECRFFPEEERIEDEEVNISWYEKRKRTII